MLVVSGGGRLLDAGANELCVPQAASASRHSAATPSPRPPRSSARRRSFPCPCMARLHCRADQPTFNGMQISGGGVASYKTSALPAELGERNGSRLAAALVVAAHGSGLSAPNSRRHRARGVRTRLGAHFRASNACGLPAALKTNDQLHHGVLSRISGGEIANRGERDSSDALLYRLSDRWMTPSRKSLLLAKVRRIAAPVRHSVPATATMS